MIQAKKKKMKKGGPGRQRNQKEVEGDLDNDDG